MRFVSNLWLCRFGSMVVSQSISGRFGVQVCSKCPQVGQIVTHPIPLQVIWSPSSSARFAAPFVFLIIFPEEESRSFRFNLSSIVALRSFVRFRLPTGRRERERETGKFVFNNKTNVASANRIDCLLFCFNATTINRSIAKTLL